MSPEALEQAIQALLDGHPLPFAARGDEGVENEPLFILDAIARADRIAVFGQDVPLDAAVQRRWGHLQVAAEIGRGAGGTVYRARDTRLGRDVALKLFPLDDGPADAALQEGSLLARLNHPHIVTVFGAGSHDGMAGVWMELLDGRTLDEILVQDGVFGCAETLIIGLQLAGALAAIHAAGLLHRDVKARNVVRERGGRIVLMDLGAGRAADVASSDGDGVGTPMYMAPEVLAGGPATCRSDLYSLGVLLYRLLTGGFPVPAASLNELRAAHALRVRVPLAALRVLDAGIVATIERACHPEAEARFRSVAEFEAALSAAFQRTISQRAVVTSAFTRALRRRRRLLVGAILATAGMTVAIWGGWNTTPGRAMRRAAGFSVPPRSTLYAVIGGGIGIIRSGQLSLAPYNPSRAGVMAVSSDLGVRTMGSDPPFPAGAHFRLDGVPVESARLASIRICCFGDGTTDGRFNYAVYQDSTLLEPIGSRPLAPPAVYRFERDWSNPQVLFALNREGGYSGLGYAAASDSFWLTRQLADAAVVEHWSRHGKHLATPIRVPSAIIRSIAVDPADDTLWMVRLANDPRLIRLENFDPSGRYLGTFSVVAPAINTGIASAEFVWVPRP